MRSHHPTPFVALLVASLVVLAACGGDDGPEGGATSSTGAGPLPGEPIEIFPYADAALIVVGVEADDVLNVRSRPGADADVVVELDPLADEIVATGQNRQLEDGSIWAEIRAGGAEGWADTRFLLQPGRTDDVTAASGPDPATRPTADTMLALGEEVAALHASTEPPSRIVVVDGPTEGDLGQVTLDVLGLGDDAVGGMRVFVFGEPVPGGSTIRTVEATTLCSRGVTSDQLCV